MSLPPEAYLLEAIRSGTSTLVTLGYEDLKKGVVKLYEFVKAEAREQADKNIVALETQLGKDIEYKLSVGVSEDGHDRISGNLKDPDFAYVLNQATISAARITNEDKTKALSRAITERLFAESESLAALVSSKACEIIPSLSPKHLSFLALRGIVTDFRPTITPAIRALSQAEQIDMYAKWLEKRLGLFKPFPKMSSVDVAHLAALGCLNMSPLHKDLFGAMLMPHRDWGFEFPKNYFVGKKTFEELKDVNGLVDTSLTSFGYLIGALVFDTRSGEKPIALAWGDEAVP